MNEKLQYASMLDMPVNTCTVTTKPTKKRRTKRKKEQNLDCIKEQLLEKINNENQVDEQLDLPVVLNDNLENFDSNYDIEQEQLSEQNEQHQTVSFTKKSTKKHKRFKFSVIGVQFLIIGALVFTILLTNSIFPNSGINNFFNGVFGAEQVQVKDERTYSDFAPVIAMGNNSGLTVTDGVINFGGKGSVYSACDGVVTDVIKDEQGKYSIEIMHSQNFKSVIAGVEYAYVNVGDAVYSNFPVGYLFDDGASMCFKSGDGNVISDYQIIDNTVVWAV